MEQIGSETSCGGAESMSALALSMKLKSRRLFLSIHHGAERRIYSKAQNILKIIRASVLEFAGPTLMETYLCKRVFINGIQYKTHLYNHDPKPELLNLSQQSGHGGKEGCSVKPLDVRQIHGANCVYRLDRFSLRLDCNGFHIQYNATMYHGTCNQKQGMFCIKDFGG